MDALLVKAADQQEAQELSIYNKYKKNLEEIDGQFDRYEIGNQQDFNILILRLQVQEQYYKALGALNALSPAQKKIGKTELAVLVKSQETSDSKILDVLLFQLQIKEQHYKSLAALAQVASRFRLEATEEKQLLDITDLFTSEQLKDAKHGQEIILRLQIKQQYYKAVQALANNASEERQGLANCWALLLMRYRERAELPTSRRTKNTAN